MVKKWIPIWVTVAILAVLWAPSGMAQAIRATLVNAQQTGTWTNRVVGNAGANVDGVTGSAAPANAWNTGFLTGDGASAGHLKTPITCDNHAFDRSTTADVQLVALQSGQIIYVCSYVITGESTTSSDVSLEYGTGSNCGTGTTGITPPRTIGSGTSGGQLPGFSILSPIWNGLKTIASNELCVHRSAAQSSEIEVWFTQF